MIGVDAGAPGGTEALARAGVELHLEERGRGAARRACSRRQEPGCARAGAGDRARRANAGMPVLGELELAWRMLQNEFVAVTGTNGKTTTVELIGHIHREAGLPVAVAGNVGDGRERAGGEGRRSGDDRLRGVLASSWRTRWRSRPRRRCC